MFDYQLSFQSDLVVGVLNRMEPIERNLVERVLQNYFNAFAASDSRTGPIIFGVPTLVATVVIRADRYIRVLWSDRFPIASIFHISIVDIEPSDDWYDDI